MYWLFRRDRPGFFDQVEHQLEISIFSLYMSSSDLPKLRTEETKIGHNLRE